MQVSLAKSREISIGGSVLDPPIRGAGAGTSHRLHVPNVGGMKHPLPRSTSGPAAQNTMMSTTTNGDLLEFCACIGYTAIIDCK